MASREVEALHQILARDRAREAVYVLEAYDWQRWLTLQAWLEVKPGGSVWVEWAEDFTVTDDTGNIRTIQVKRSRDPLTLNTAAIREVVIRALSRPAEVVTAIWTSANAAREKGSTLSEPAIDYWQKAAQKALPLEPLRKYLTEATWVPDSARKRLSSTNANAFRSALSQVQWIMGDGGIEQVRDRVEKLLAQRLSDLCVAQPATFAGLAIPVLFEFVTRASALPDPQDRRLTYSALDDELLAYNQAVNGALAERLESERYFLQSLDPRRMAPRSGPFAPFSAAWFTYGHRAIAMVGREHEVSALTEFADSEPPFSWWVVGGPAGMGKSRLALEFLLALPPSWTGAFVGPEDLARLSNELHPTQSLFVVIDYAGSRADEVGRFLRLAGRSAKIGNKVRVLLLERDVADSADWWRKLLPPFSSRAADLRLSLFRSPASLSPLAGREQEVVKAWLEAAGLDLQRSLPRHKDRFWHNLRGKVDARPLLLGFAAAALSRGEKRFDGVEDLLRGCLAREYARWLDRAGCAPELDPILALAATATASGGLPIMWPGDEHSIVIHDGEKEKAAYIVDRQGNKRLPRVDDLLRIPGISDKVELEMAKQQKHVLSILQPIFSKEQDINVLSSARNIIESWSISPDLLAEYYLGRYWGIRTAHQKDFPVTAVDEKALQTQIGAALHLNPTALLDTLDRLREHSWSAAAAVRALVELSAAVVEKNRYSDEFRVVLAQKIFNSMIRVGDRRPSLEQMLSLTGAARLIACSAPRHRMIRYYLWKSLAILTDFLSPEDRSKVSAELVGYAPSLLGFKSRMEPTRFPLEDNAIGLAVRALPFLEKEGIPSSLAPVVKLALKIAKIDSSLQGSNGVASRLLMNLSWSPAIASAPPALRRSKISMLQKIKSLAELWVRAGDLNGGKARSDMAWAISNLMLNFRRLKMAKEVEELYELLTPVADEFQSDDEIAHASVVATANLLRARLDADDLAGAESLVKVSVELASLESSLLQRGFLEMWQHLANHALARNDYRRVCQYLINVGKTTWDIDDRELRFNIVYFFQSCVGVSQDSDTERGLDQLYFSIAAATPKLWPVMAFAHAGLFIQLAPDEKAALHVLGLAAKEWLELAADVRLSQRLAWGIMVFLALYGAGSIGPVQKAVSFSLCLKRGKTVILLPDRDRPGAENGFEFGIPGHKEWAEFVPFVENSLAAGSLSAISRVAPARR